MRILLLGGTAEGRVLAEVLVDAGHEVVSSVAGRTAQARDASDGRVGGFGGAAGLADYLRTNQIATVVDATHPFAARMTHNAWQACAELGVPLVRLSRPGWVEHQYASEWTWVADHQAAAAAAAGAGRALLTVGRQPLPNYHGLPNVLARVAEWQGAPVPAGWQILEERGPFSLDHELELLRSAQIAVLVSKDSGGEHTAAKVDAAHELGVRVIMVARPEPPVGLAQVASTAEVLEWLGRCGVS